MIAGLLLGIILAMSGVLMAPLLGLTGVLLIVAVLALIGAAFRSLFGILEAFLDHPLVKAALIAIAIWIAIGLLKLPVAFVVAVALVLAALAFLGPFFSAIEAMLSSLFEPFLMKVLLILGILIAIVIASGK